MNERSINAKNARSGIMDKQEAITFRDVSKTFMSPTFEPFTAVSGVNLDISPGSFVSVVGPSGCGKSTLLNMIAGLMRPTSGEVCFEGKRVTGVNHKVAYMSQKDNLLPWRTALENVRLPLEILGIGRKERIARARDVLEQVGLGKAADKYPAGLSGGMRKRVALARSLVYEPNTLLMDEPFGALDAQLRLALQAQLLQLWERDRKTVLFVTHDISEAILLADKVVIFGSSPGHIKHVEEVDLPRPRNLVDAQTRPEVLAMWRDISTKIEIDDLPVGIEPAESGMRSR